MKHTIGWAIALIFFSCASGSDDVSDSTAAAVSQYPDTTREENYGGDGYTLHIYHDEHLRETQTFYESGLMAMQFFMLDDEEDSVSTWWHENGTMQLQRRYKNGKQTGWDRSWYADGALETESYYENGQLHGWYRIWNPDSTLREESYYENDSLIKGSRVYMDEYGSIVYSEIIEDGKVVRIDSSLKGTDVYWPGQTE